MKEVWVIKGKGVSGAGAMSGFRSERTWGPYETEEIADKQLEKFKNAHTGTRRHFSGRVVKVSRND